MPVNHQFLFRDVAWGRVLECAPLAHVARHAFTMRDIDFKPAGRENGRAWDALAAYFGVPGASVWWPHQVHGGDVAIVSRVEGAPTERRPEADVILSDDPDRVVAVQVADCVALLLADRRTGAVAAVHAGWRGTARGVGRAAVRAMERQFGTRPGDIVAAIGPSIGPCCYEVGEDVRRAFMQAGAGDEVGGWFGGREGQNPHLDLWRANRDQLQLAGVPPSQVHVAALCTATRRDLFFSYRAEGPAAGRMVAAIRAATGQ